MTMVSAAPVTHHRWSHLPTRSCQEPFFASRTTNGLLEGLNSLIQATKARARGDRTADALKSIVYLIGSALVFNLPILYSE